MNRTPEENSLDTLKQEVLTAYLNLQIPETVGSERIKWEKQYEKARMQLEAKINGTALAE